MTTCTSLACNRTATHYARRFGPESPYCLEDAWWADGILLAFRNQMTSPPLLDSTRVDDQAQAR